MEGCGVGVRGGEISFPDLCAAQSIVECLSADVVTIGHRAGSIGREVRLSSLSALVASNRGSIAAIGSRPRGCRLPRRLRGRSAGIASALSCPQSPVRSSVAEIVLGIGRDGNLSGRSFFASVISTLTVARLSWGKRSDLLHSAFQFNANWAIAP